MASGGDIESTPMPEKPVQAPGKNEQAQPAKVMALSLIAIAGIVWGSVMTALYVRETKTQMGRYSSTHDESHSSSSSSMSIDCDESRDLDDFPQWREEVGYWLGDLSFYKGDGTPNEAADWNYPYDNYKGFITGNINGGTYRQRNVFLYPPQTPEKCAVNASTVGNGVCGTNGNSKNFEADQSISGLSCDGSIEGPFGPFNTKTTLVGEGTAVLYQVFMGDSIFQSQLTTLSGNGRRTRSAQNFDIFLPGVPTHSSFYRERRVNATEFYDALRATLDEFDILDADACARDGQGNAIDGVVGGFDTCLAHLEESFRL